MNGCFNMIGGGVRARTKVIAVTSKDALPATAREGTIAIISDIPVGNVYVCVTPPATIKRGDVVIIPVGTQKNWTYVIGNAVIPFNYVVQWNGSEWALSDAYQYNGSQWAKDFFYLLDGQVEGVQWSTINYGSLTRVEKTSYGYMLQGANNGNQPVAIQTTHTIDLTGYKTLQCYGANDNDAENYYPFTFGIMSKRITSEPASFYQNFAKNKSADSRGEFVLEIDLTNYKGEYYVACVGAHEATHVRVIWLGV